MLPLPPLFFFFPTATAVHFYNPLKAQTHWLVSAQAFDRRRLFGQKAQYQGSRTHRASKGEPAQVFFFNSCLQLLKKFTHTIDQNKLEFCYKRAVLQTALHWGTLAG